MKPTNLCTSEVAITVFLVLLISYLWPDYHLTAGGHSIASMNAGVGGVALIVSIAMSPWHI